jgi:thymidylate kinase
MTYMVRLTFPLLRGRVVLLDRHVLDATVDLAERLGTRDPRNLFSWRILQRLAPHPQIHLFFDVPPEIAMQRKESGMDRDQMERRHALYRALAPSGALMIDTTRDPDLVAEEVGLRILEAALEGRP